MDDGVGLERHDIPLFGMRFDGCTLERSEESGPPKRIVLRFEEVADLVCHGLRRDVGFRDGVFRPPTILSFAGSLCSTAMASCHGTDEPFPLDDRHHTTINAERNPLALGEEIW
jgi:hypothetical protein